MIKLAARAGRFFRLVKLLKLLPGRSRQLSERDHSCPGGVSRTKGNESRTATTTDNCVNAVVRGTDVQCIPIISNFVV